MYDIKDVPSVKISYDMLDASVITSFLDWLESDRKSSVCTRNYRLAAFKSFAKYASTYDFEAAGKFDAKKIAAHAKTFSRDRFIKEFKAACEKALAAVQEAVR